MILIFISFSISYYTWFKDIVSEIIVKRTVTIAAANSIVESVNIDKILRHGFGGLFLLRAVDLAGGVSAADNKRSARHNAGRLYIP
jgi:hypothetical protein